MASQKDILIAFLEDEELKRKFNLTEHDIETIDMSSEHNQLIVNVLKAAVRIIERDDLTITTAASNINNTLDNLLSKS